MPFFTVLTVFVVTASFIFSLVVARQVFRYNIKTHLNQIEDRYTRLFGFIQKEHVAIIYLILAIVHVIFTTWFLWTL